ncbi:MAG TPA: AAA family ATPase [Stellaceae bacterium]|nr:AAA family ATPase [Stellaceae bacterium]
MHLRNYTAPTIQEAMALVRQELGPDAIIISTDDDPEDGARVTAALERAEPDIDETYATADVTDILSEALAAGGVPVPLAEKLLMASLTFDTEDEISALSGALAATFSFAPVPEQGRTRPLLMVGPPGAGKTMTVAKLAARAVIARRPVRVIAADTVRAGAIEQIAAVARILGISLTTAESGGRLALAVASAAPEELVLIDGFGINPYNAADRRELAALIAAAGAEPMLVLAAGGDALDTVEIARIFRDLGCSRMTATRLDLTSRLGSLLAAADAAKLAFAEAGTAPEIADGLLPLDPLLLARRLLTQSPLERQIPQKKRVTS